MKKIKFRTGAETGIVHNTLLKATVYFFCNDEAELKKYSIEQQLQKSVPVINRAQILILMKHHFKYYEKKS